MEKQNEEKEALKGILLITIFEALAILLFLVINR